MDLIIPVNIHFLQIFVDVHVDIHFCKYTSHTLLSLYTIHKNLTCSQSYANYNMSSAVMHLTHTCISLMKQLQYNKHSA